MKTVSAVAVMTLVMVGNLFAGSGSQNIIYNRAKELRDQNNVRQGVPSPSQAAQPAAQPAAAATAPRTVTATPQQVAVSKLQTAIAQIRPDSQVTADQKQQLARELVAAAQGASKPSLQSATKAAEDLSALLSQKLLSTATRTRLAQDLYAAVNPGSLQPTQMDGTFSDIQAIFQANGIERKEAVKATDSVKTLSGELKKTAAK